tara:strand:- start:319 stop:570 length:252 start_codon:yes stop_codon:yes gene_type:complete
MIKKKTIRPELFEVKHEYSKTYVIAYDMIHALQSMPSYTFDVTLEVSQLTGSGKNMINYLEVAKECLPQGLVNKTVDDNKSKT